ncbi:hypothetical protein AAVH_38054, partial [Aphelenchoides avenae]
SRMPCPKFTRGCPRLQRLWQEGVCGRDIHVRDLSGDAQHQTDMDLRFVRDEPAPLSHDVKVQQGNATADRGDMSGYSQQRQLGGHVHRCLDVASQPGPDGNRARFAAAEPAETWLCTARRRCQRRRQRPYAARLCGVTASSKRFDADLR